VEAARRVGIHLTLLIHQLRFSPAERAQRMLDAVEVGDAIRGAARSLPDGKGI
jgi:hypothetical protein